MQHDSTAPRALHHGELVNSGESRKTDASVVIDVEEGPGEAWICMTCGAQQEQSQAPPADTCKLCEDERQYTGADGQKWTTAAHLSRDHTNIIHEFETGLTGIGTEPSFAIGQRAVLVQTPQGNILWDCISLLDRETAKAVEERGGIRAIAISHPHFYSAMCDWSRHFNAPIYIHQWDEDWISRSDAEFRMWEGDSQELFGGCTLYRLGGHFPGSAVLHVPSTDQRPAICLSGDTIQCTPRKGFVSYMYSYPVYIPLPASTVEDIRDKVAALPEFEKIYGGWWAKNVQERGKAAAVEGAERYLAALEGKYVQSYPGAGYSASLRH